MSVPCVVADFAACCATAFPEREMFSLYMQVETEVFVNECVTSSQLKMLEQLFG